MKQELSSKTQQTSKDTIIDLVTFCWRWCLPEYIIMLKRAVYMCGAGNFLI